MYFWWCRAADPVLLHNPLHVKLLSMVTPCLLTPFYLVSCIAIHYRLSFIRIPSIVAATLLLVVLSTFLVEATWGEHSSPDLRLYETGFGYFQLFPLLLLWRFWSDDPFDEQQKQSGGGADKPEIG